MTRRLRMILTRTMRPRKMLKKRLISKRNNFYRRSKTVKKWKISLNKSSWGIINRVCLRLKQTRLKKVDMHRLTRQICQASLTKQHRTIELYPKTMMTMTIMSKKMEVTRIMQIGRKAPMFKGMKMDQIWILTLRSQSQHSSRSRQRKWCKNTSRCKTARVPGLGRATIRFHNLAVRKQLKGQHFSRSSWYPQL